MLDREGAVVWFTGLSGAGKSTLAMAVAKQLADLGWTVEVVDGDDLRRQLSAGLGFSRTDREENARRAACLAQALARRCDFVLVALITPYRAVREEIAATLSGYLEVFVNAPLSVCEARDPKGLYRRARAGMIRNFTGVDDPYEPPLHAALECRTDRESVEHSVCNVVQMLTRGKSWIRNPAVSVHAAVDGTPPVEPASTALIRDSVHTSLLRFRVSTAMKERFKAVSEEFGTTPSVLMRRFINAVVARPLIAERILSAHFRPGNAQTRAVGDLEGRSMESEDFRPQRGHKILRTATGRTILPGATPEDGAPIVVPREKTK